MPPPTSYVPHIRTLLDGLGLDAIDRTSERTLVDTAFLDFLLEEFARLLPFDPDHYAHTYADVADAHRRGAVGDLHAHFIRDGFREGRLPFAEPFDTEYYLDRNADLAAVLQRHGRPGLQAHYEKDGRQEGRAGHPAIEADARRWWSAVRRTPYRLTQRSIDGAFVQAFMSPIVADPPLGFRGGLVLGDTPADLRLRHRRGRDVVDTFPRREEPVNALPGAYVYGGPYVDHFGHTMAELIHRVLPARAMFDCKRLLFVGQGLRHEVAGFAALPPVMQAPLLFLGVDPADVTVIHDHRVVERLHVTQQGATLTGGPTAPYLRMLSEYTPARLRALGDEAAARPATRVYVSRSQIPLGGMLLGERYLEEELAAEGWQIVHPQRLSLLGQMQTYQRAEAIIFAEGSAIHGTELFGAEALGHCVLMPRRLNRTWLFENTLRPRARRFDMLPAAVQLGTLLADEGSGALLENLGVSVLDLPAIADAVRGLGLAALDNLNLESYRAAARADLAAYIALHSAPGAHRMPGTKLVDRPSRAGFDARCRAVLS